MYWSSVPTMPIRLKGIRATMASLTSAPRYTGMESGMSKAPYVSIVTPVYGCKTCLAQLHSRLAAVLTKITPDFEIIMVNDASPDGAWATIEELAARDPRVKGINLSRNFGQHQAITAGLDYTSGEWVIVMD